MARRRRGRRHCEKCGGPLLIGGVGGIEGEACPTCRQGAVIVEMDVGALLGVKGVKVKGRFKI